MSIHGDWRRDQGLGSVESVCGTATGRNELLEVEVPQHCPQIQLYTHGPKCSIELGEADLGDGSSNRSKTPEPSPGVRPVYDLPATWPKSWQQMGGMR